MKKSKELWSKDIAFALSKTVKGIEGGAPTQAASCRLHFLDRKKICGQSSYPDAGYRQKKYQARYVAPVVAYLA